MAIWTSPSALAQQQQFESAKLSAPNITTNNFFGYKAAISGPWALVGDYSAGGGGEVYFYRRGSGGWALEQLVRGPQSSRMGSVAIDGDVAVLGMMTWDWAASRTGKVRVYELQGEEWIQVQELLPPGLKWSDIFGQGVGISGDVLVVGAPAVDRHVTNSGALYVYERQAGVWTLVQTLYLPRNPNTILGHKYLGRSIAVEGDCIVAGAPGTYGAAYVYERGPQGWAQVAVLTDATPSAGDRLGTSVSISGDTIVVGEPALGPVGWNYRAGSAFIHERDSAGTWNLVREIQASDGFGGSDYGDHFGSSVAISTDRIVVGADNGKNWAKLDGKGYLFERGPTGSWPATETRQLMAASPPQSKRDSLGEAAAMDDEFILLGGPLSEGGSVYVFEFELGMQYCSQAPNSTGKPARLTVTGTELASEQTLTLSVRDCPADVPGLFLLSSGRESQRIANGSGWLQLCLGPRAVRLSPMAATGPGGVAIHTLDFSDPLIGGFLLAGTTRYFQFAYRDPALVTTSFSLSNAIAVTLK